MKKNIWIIIAVVVVVLLLVVSMLIPEKQEEKYKEKMLNINYDVDGNEAELHYGTSNPVVALYIEGYGSVVIELYPDVAPNTVNNFISLVKSGFYDNNSFHRLVPGFVLQGGDPDGTGTGGPGYNIKGEFTSNGFENNLLHEFGVVSMARSQDNDSAGSQFFICLGTASNLDGEYAAFGKVIDGMKNVQAIERREAIADQTTGKLKKNLVLKKALIDLNGKEYPEVEKVD